MDKISTKKILPNPEQPRKDFDQIALSDLAASIRENGIIQPLVVEDAGNGNYILHDGERRLRAAKLAGLEEVPVSIVPPLGGTSKEDRLIRAMVANIQRDDLNPIEEGRAYKRMMDELGMTANRIAIKMGTNNVRVGNRLKLLKLEPEIIQSIATGKLTSDPRLVDALFTLPDSVTRVKVVRKIIEKKMTIVNSLTMIEKINQHMAADNLGKDEVPAIRIAVRHEGEIKKPLWDAFASVGKLPPWVLFEVSVRDTCKQCSLRDMASEATCKDCPMVFLVRMMIGATK